MAGTGWVAPCPLHASQASATRRENEGSSVPTGTADTSQTGMRTSSCGGTSPGFGGHPPGGRPAHPWGSQGGSATTAAVGGLGVSRTLSEGDRDLAGKVALVTASSGGIGRAIALALARAGADVAVNYHRHAAAGEAVAEDIRRLGVRAACIGADGTQRDQLRALVAGAQQQLGTVDILVNNLGEFAYKPTADHSDEEFERIIAGTVGATFYATLAVLPGMRARGWGRVINLGASGAEHALGSRREGPHLAGKAAVVSLTRTLALEEGRRGITFNVVCPGIVNDRGLSRAEAEHRRDRDSPVGRPGTSEDIADAVRFLARPGSSFINGATLEVTGGWYG